MQKHQTSRCFSVFETQAHQSTSTPKNTSYDHIMLTKKNRSQKIFWNRNTHKKKQILVGGFNPSEKYGTRVTINMHKSHWIMLSWIWVKVQKMFETTRQIFMQNPKTFKSLEKQKSQSHEDPSDKAHGKSSFTLFERSTQVTYFWSFFCLVVFSGVGTFR